MTAEAPGGKVRGSDPGDHVTEQEARLLQEVARRAAGRLDVLEWVALTLAAALATAGGAVVAWLLAPALGVPGRTLWVVSSVLMFGVPGWAALRRRRRGAGPGE